MSIIEMPQSTSFNLNINKIAIAVPAALLLTTLVVTLAERRQVTKASAQTFALETQVLSEDLSVTMEANENLSHGAVAHVVAAETINKASWMSYTSSLKLDERFPEMEAFAFLPVIEGAEEMAAFEAKIRATEIPDFTVRPPGARPLYAPVLYLDRIQNATGFDLLSEPTRRSAIERVIQTGEASMTEPIKLVTDDPNNAGLSVLLLSPVLNAEHMPGDMPRGMIVSVFRISDLAASVLGRADNYINADMRVALEAILPTGERTTMYSSPDMAELTPRYTQSEELEFFGQRWLLKAASTPRYEQRTDRSRHLIFLYSGILLSLLLGYIGWAEARSQESLVAAQRLRESNERIDFVMREINHRYKNMLSLIGVIARQTSLSNPKQFRETFSKRLRSLAASQDLLVSNLVSNIEKDILLDPLLRTQLAHFETLLDTRIFLSGPDISIQSPDRAQTLCMAIYELSTNAAKYGSLTNDTGTIHITWDILYEKSEPGFSLTWRERGGPPVDAPSEHGFGSQVTVKMIQLTFKGNIETRFDRGGFEWHMTCPLAMLGTSVEAQKSKVGAIQ